MRFEEEYGWFSEEDFKLLLIGISKNPIRKEMVLVGGQSLVAWAIYYGIPIPENNDIALTRDVDFLGNKDDATAIAEALGAKVTVAQMEEGTPNSAVVTWRSPISDKLLTLDFMKTLIGLDNQEIRDISVPMRFEGTPDIQVLHPIHCLVSRFENLHKLKNKRDGNGLTQARVAVEVAKAFVDQLLASGEKDDQRFAIKIAGMIGRIATSDAGGFVFANYGLDPLIAVDSTRFTEFPDFAKKDWPNRLRWATTKRAKAIKQYQSASRIQKLRIKTH